MNAAAWVFLVAWLVALAALVIVLLGASSAKADLERAYLKLAAKFLRSEQTSAALREDNANLEATVTHLRRQLIRAVDDQPVPLLPTEAADRAAFDAIVRGWEGA